MGDAAFQAASETNPSELRSESMQCRHLYWRSTYCRLSFKPSREESGSFPNGDEDLGLTRACSMLL